MLRVDVALRANPPYDERIEVPDTATLGAWVDEVMGRLTETEPLLPAEPIHESEDGRFEILAWQGSPHIEAECRATAACCCAM